MVKPNRVQNLIKFLTYFLEDTQFNTSTQTIQFGRCLFVIHIGLCGIVFHHNYEVRKLHQQFQLQMNDKYYTVTNNSAEKGLIISRPVKS